MEASEAQALERENAYLKARCAQLQDDVTALSSEVERSRQALERVGVRRAATAAPDPLAGGQ